jgi:hypothetical protein
MHFHRGERLLRLEPRKESRMVDAFVSRMDSMTGLPLGSIAATEIVA